LALTLKSREQKGRMVKGTCKSDTDVLEEDRERSKRRKPSASRPSFGQDPGARGTISCAAAWRGATKTQLEASKRKFRIKRNFRLRCVRGGL
jgi:hypothetical protein